MKNHQAKLLQQVIRSVIAEALMPDERLVVRALRRLEGDSHKLTGTGAPVMPESFAVKMGEVLRFLRQGGKPGQSVVPYLRFLNSIVPGSPEGEHWHDLLEPLTVAVRAKGMAERGV